MRGKKHLLLSAMRGGSWLERKAALYDEFITDDAAPATTPRKCEPGPGTLNLVETDGAWNITGEELVSTGQTTPAWGALGFYGEIAARAAGVGFFTKVDQAGAIGYPIRWSAGTTLTTATDCGVQFNVAKTYYYDGAAIIQLAAALPAGYFDIGLILRASGAFFVIDTDGTGWKLWWVDERASTANVYPTCTLLTSSPAFARVTILSLVPAGYDWSDAGVATNITASPSTGATSTSTADSIVEFTWSCATGETLDLFIRRTDDTHAWIVRCDEATNTIKLIEVNGGETERDSDAQTFNNGSDYRIVVRTIDETITTAVNTAAKNTWPTAAYNKTVTGVKVSGFATGANLICWPYDVDSLLPPELKP